jgi:hypothetical protein
MTEASLYVQWHRWKDISSVVLLERYKHVWMDSSTVQKHEHLWAIRKTELNTRRLPDHK